MLRQETEHFSEAIHPLYHPANKAQSDWRETSLEQHHPSAVLMAGCWGSGIHQERSAGTCRPSAPPR